MSGLSVEPVQKPTRLRRHQVSSANRGMRHYPWSRWRRARVTERLCRLCGHRRNRSQEAAQDRGRHCLHPSHASAKVLHVVPPRFGWPVELGLPDARLLDVADPARADPPPGTLALLGRQRARRPGTRAGADRVPGAGGLDAGCLAGLTRQCRGSLDLTSGPGARPSTNDLSAGRSRPPRRRALPSSPGALLGTRTALPCPAKTCGMAVAHPRTSGSSQLTGWRVGPGIDVEVSRGWRF